MTLGMLSSEGGVWGPIKCFDFGLRNVELLCILDLEQGDSTASVIMMFMTLAQQYSIDRLVLPIFYYCTTALSNVASTPLSCDRL